ncbi:hypothetical protein ACJX0J_014306, partial [Zea mays]
MTVSKGHKKKLQDDVAGTRSITEHKKIITHNINFQVLGYNSFYWTNKSIENRFIKLANNNIKVPTPWLDLSAHFVKTMARQTAYLVLKTVQAGALIAR